MTKGGFRQQKLGLNLNGNLLCLFEEPSIGCLKFRLHGVEISSTYTSIESLLFLSILEAKRVNSVGAAEELSLGWIALNVFPSGVGPSAWHELQVLFRIPLNSCLLLKCKLILVIVAAWVLRSSSVVVSASAEPVRIVV